MASGYPGVEGVILDLLLQGRITTGNAQTYEANLDSWRANVGSYEAQYPQQWVGVSGGITVAGPTFDDVSTQIFAQDPNGRPFIGFVLA